MVGLHRIREPRIHRASLPRQAAFGTSTEISTSCPASDIGGPPPSSPGPLPGAATCTVATASSTATAASVPTAFRFAAAGIRAVRRGIQPLFGVIILVGF